MAKKKEQPKPAPKSAAQAFEMTLAQAKAYRASLHKPQPKVLSEDEKREAFRIFWTSQKAKYGKGKSLEKALWLHLKAIGMNTPDKFEDGLANFGIKKV